MRNGAMDRLMSFYLRMHNQEAQTLAEYALILGLIAVVAVGAVTLMGTNVTAVINRIAAAL